MERRDPNSGAGRHDAEKLAPARRNPLLRCGMSAPRRAAAWRGGRDRPAGGRHGAWTGRIRRSNLRKAAGRGLPERLPEGRLSTRVPGLPITDTGAPMAEKKKREPTAKRAAPARPADPAAAPMTLARRIREAPPGSPLLLRIRLIALGVLILALALIFAVPRRPEPPRSLDHPDQAFIDRAGLVSQAYAWETAGVLQRDPRYQMVVYVDAAPPDGRLAGWTSERATAWRIGEHQDNGIALFVFRDARIARAEIGYGLEDRLPDALMRRLLEDRLAPRFAAGDFEGGFDAFIKGVGEALGGAEAMHKLWQELGGKPRNSTTAMLLDTYSEGIERAPRMIAATWRTYIEGGPTERLFVLVCVGIFLAILAATVSVALVTVGIAVKLARGRSDAAGAQSGADAFASSPRARLAAAAFGLLFGSFTVALFSMILLFALSLIGEQMHRKGDFSGAGAQVVWAADR